LKTIHGQLNRKALITAKEPKKKKGKVFFNIWNGNPGEIRTLGTMILDLAFLKLIV